MGTSHVLISPNWSLYWSSLSMRVSLKFSSIGAIPSFSLIYSFLSLFIIVCLYIHLSIPISTTLIFCSCAYFTAQHLYPYNIADLTRAVKLPLEFYGYFSHIQQDNVIYKQHAPRHHVMNMSGEFIHDNCKKIRA